MRDQTPPRRPALDIDPDKLNFSEFHPLDHTIWECTDYPGGKRRHLQYRWDFHWKSQVRRYTTCLLGQHEWAVWYGRDLPNNPDEMVAVAVSCRHCHRKASEAEATAAMVADEQAWERRRR